VGRRWRTQVLGFCGFKPVRILRLGPTRRGAAAKRLSNWKIQIARLAKSASALKRGEKPPASLNRADFARAIADRRS
jgi:hypothetical protein